MLPNDLKNIYSNSTEDFHNAMLCSLVRLNDKAQRRYKRYRILKVVIICIIIACLCTTSVLATSNIYGIFSEKISNYGMNVNIVPEENIKLPEYVKLKLNYLPEGVSESPCKYGEKFSLNGEGREMCCDFSIIILDSEFNVTNKFITNSRETVINGNRVIINTRQFDETELGAEKIFYEYLDDLGVVFVGLCDNEISDKEIEKIIEGAEVSEGTEDDHYEAVDLASELSQSSNPPHVLYGYPEQSNNSFILNDYGHSFYYSDFDSNNKTYSVNVKSFELHDNVSDLSRDNFNFMEYDGEKPFSTYFDENGDIISDYTRVYTEYGDGINSINKGVSVNTKRHFVLVNIDVTCLEPISEWENIGFDLTKLHLANLGRNGSNSLAPKYTQYYTGTMVYNNGVDKANNLLCIDVGETREVSVGFFVDEDYLEDLYFVVVSRNINNDSENEKIFCFPFER
ncbi:MAG: hypothetical protein J1E85_01150 [Ruminococcus sp.]|nr:hypothetical protein [Ruminococcus sp.]